MKMKIWASKRASWNYVLFVIDNPRRSWMRKGNWKLYFYKSNNNIYESYFLIILPFLRLTRCNGKFEFGLGNYYLVFGYRPH